MFEPKEYKEEYLNWLFDTVIDEMEDDADEFVMAYIKEDVEPEDCKAWAKIYRVSAEKAKAHPQNEILERVFDEQYDRRMDREYDDWREGGVVAKHEARGEA